LGPGHDQKASKTAPIGKAQSRGAATTTVTRNEAIAPLWPARSRRGADAAGNGDVD